MTKSIALLAMGILFAANAGAQEANALWHEYDKLIESHETIGAMGPTLFGDSVNYYTGALQFSTTDISVPGNSALPIAVTRKKAITHGGGFGHPFADWELDLPSVGGVFSTSTGWVTLTTVAERCSKPGPPPAIDFTNNAFQPHEYWAGTTMSLPGGGGGELLMASRNGGEIVSSPTGRTRPGVGGPYYWVTSDWTYVSCLPSVLNDAGQGFLAITSNGTKYWFNWMASNSKKALKKVRRGFWATGFDYVYRREYKLYATRVEDRFGNWVTYTYSNAASSPVSVTSIDASDGRHVGFTYNAQGHIESATDGTHTWQYQYGPGVYANGTPNGQEILVGVVLPDGTRWSIDFGRLSAVRLWYYDKEPGVQSRTCYDPGDVDDSEINGTITHPSGAVGTFAVRATRFGRSNVLAMCSNVTVSQTYESGGWQYTTPPNDPNDDTAYYPIAWDTIALTRKEVSGPGLTPAEWDYQYLSSTSWFLDPSGGGAAVCTAGDCISPQCVSDSCAGHTVAQVWGPDNGYTRYTFGNSYRYNEGKLLKTQTGTAQRWLAPTSIARTVTNSYQLQQSGQAYPTPIGLSPQARSGAGFDSEYVRPQSTNVINQDGVNFSNTASTFDRFARPNAVSKSSSLGYAKSEVTQYYDDLSQWVLGQVATVTNTSVTPNVVVSKTDYDANSLPWKVYGPGTAAVPGKLLQKIIYNTTAAISTGQLGTVSSVTDGLGNITSVSNWKRGIPQSIVHPATPEAPNGTTESAVVNNDGTLASVTDELGNKTCYAYDGMGRIASVTHPSETTIGACDASTWAVTTQNFVPVATAEYGLPAGHWRQQISTGDARKFSYFDALWRPLVVLEYDAAAMASTQRFVRHAYDASGHETFVSYPGSTDALTLGTRTEYDALDRVTRVDQDSELGVPTSTITAYLSGFQRRITNPRGKITTQKFEVYDTPSYDSPAQIDVPEGQRTVIQRSKLGKPTAITRSGPGT